MFNEDWSGVMMFMELEL